MEQASRAAANWRDAGAYAPLLAADRSMLAWEWLRRDPGYREAACRALERPASRFDDLVAERWGLHRFEPPEFAAPEARPVWRAGVHPFVLCVTADPPGAPDDSFDLSRLASMATLVRDCGGGEHWLLSDGLRGIRLDVPAGSLASGAVRLQYRLAGIASAEKPLLVLRRLIAVQRTGRFSRSLHPPESRARRWVLLLRAHDALVAGADQRTIASTLLGSAAAEPRWRSHAPSLRSQAQRLVRAARSMAGGGYWALLG